MEFYRGIFKQLKETPQLNIKEVTMYEDEYSVMYENVMLGDQYDIDIYVSQCPIEGRKVLELACGTGRVGIPLAKLGYEVTGIDISGDMLEIYRQKLEKEPKRVRNAITLIEGDVTNMELNEKYDMIILPATTICLFGKELCQKLFAFVREHLAENGVFVFDWMCIDKERYRLANPDAELGKWTDEKGFHFVLIKEFLYEELNELVVNVYEETVNDEGTSRSIGYTRKNIVERKNLEDVTAEAKFELAKEIVPEFGENKNIIFWVLRKAE